MKRPLKRTLAGSVAVLSGLLIQAAGPLAVSAHAAPPVVDLQTCGSSYGEFSARWWQWLLSIPRATSPILDTSGIHCGRGQVDDIWFLAGTFGATVTRSCTVPAGKPIFFALVNTSVFKPYGYETILDLRAGAAAAIDGVKMPDHAEDSAHGLLHPEGETAAHPIEPPSTTPAARRILAMAQAMAAVRALPARSMTARSGAPSCRIQEAVGLGNRRLQIGRSGPFLTVFLACSGPMGLQIRQELASLGPIFAFGAPSATAS